MPSSQVADLGGGGSRDQTFLDFMQCKGKFNKVVSQYPPEGWHPPAKILDPPLESHSV